MTPCHPPTRALTTALAIMLAVYGLAEAGCAGYKFKPGYGVRTGSTTKRFGPAPRVRYPDGVSPPQPVVVAYPRGTSRVRAVEDFLGRAADRGAGWVSELRMMVTGSRPCDGPLLPATVSKDYDATYLKEDSYAGGNSDYELETKTESVDVPFLRALDDIDSIVKDIDIWTSKRRDVCSVPDDASIEISAGIHGRVGIGVRADAARIDLTRCGDAPAAASQDDDDATTVLLLGNIRAMDVADHVLPSWVKARVLLELADKKVQGVLTRYTNGTMSVHGDDGSWTYAHVMDAKGIVLLDASAARGTSPTPAGGAPPAAAPAAEDACRGWRPEGGPSQTL